MVTNNNELVNINFEEDSFEQKVKNLNTDDLNAVVTLFNNHIKKKELIRVNKYNSLCDTLYDEIQRRLINSPSLFENSELLDYLKTFQSFVNKYQKDDSFEFSPVKIQQNNLNVTLNQAQELSRESKEKITDIVKQILTKVDNSDNKME